MEETTEKIYSIWDPEIKELGIGEVWNQQERSVSYSSHTSSNTLEWYLWCFRNIRMCIQYHVTVFSMTGFEAQHLFREVFLNDFQCHCQCPSSFICLTSREQKVRSWWVVAGDFGYEMCVRVCFACIVYDVSASGFVLADEKRYINSI